jgi:hypothetical protein
MDGAVTATLSHASDWRGAFHENVWRYFHHGLREGSLPQTAEISGLGAQVRVRPDPAQRTRLDHLSA